MLQKCVDMHFALNFENLCSPKLKKDQQNESPVKEAANTLDEDMKGEVKEEDKAQDVESSV